MDKPRRILYIDDDPGLRRLVEKLLGRRGHTVVVAASGQEGVERAREGHFDLIALDHFMPGMDGMETLAALQQLPDCPPVVDVEDAPRLIHQLSAVGNWITERNRPSWRMASAKLS